MSRVIPSVSNMPPGFYTPRVQLSLTDLIDRLTDLANLAKPIEHQITPEPDFALPFSIAQLQPNSLSLSNPVTQVFVRGDGFALGSVPPAVTFTTAGPPPATLSSAPVYFRSESLLVATLPPGLTRGVWDVIVTNPDNIQAVLTGGFTVTL